MKDEYIDMDERMRITEVYSGHDLIVWAFFDEEKGEMGPDSDTHILLPSDEKKTICGLDVPDADELGLVGNNICAKCATLVSNR